MVPIVAPPEYIQQVIDAVLHVEIFDEDGHMSCFIFEDLCLGKQKIQTMCGMLSLLNPHTTLFIDELEEVFVSGGVTDRLDAFQRFVVFVGLGQAKEVLGVMRTMRRIPGPR